MDNKPMSEPNFNQASYVVLGFMLGTLIIGALTGFLATQHHNSMATLCQQQLDEKVMINAMLRNEYMLPPPAELVIVE